MSASLTKYLTANVLFNSVYPFTSESHVAYESVAGTTVYGVDVVGSAPSSNASAGLTTSQRWTQTLTGNLAFPFDSTMATPQNTTGGALAALDQLRVTLRVNSATITPLLRARGDQTAPSGGFVVAAGGGTAVADATLTIKGTTAANLLVGSILMSIASSGADTQTILVGDKITVAGDSTDYYATATTASLNGTTEVNVAITPPLQVAKVAGQVVTIAAASGKTLLVHASSVPAVGITVVGNINAAADISTIGGGALTAGRIYDDECRSFLYSAGNCNVTATFNS